jgi:hypothetical protein
VPVPRWLLGERESAPNNGAAPDLTAYADSRSALAGHQRLATFDRRRADDVTVRPFRQTRRRAADVHHPRTGCSSSESRSAHSQRPAAQPARSRDALAMRDSADLRSHARLGSRARPPVRHVTFDVSPAYAPIGSCDELVPVAALITAQCHRRSSIIGDDDEVAVGTEVETQAVIRSE